MAKRKQRKKSRKTKEVEVEAVALSPVMFYIPRRRVKIVKALVVRFGKDIEEAYATCH
jgi:hypothetical protein